MFRVAQLAEIQRATAEHFHGTLAREHTYDALVSQFRTLLGPHNILTKTRYLKRSRAWRLVLLMNPQGYWEATPGLAPALQAQRVLPVHIRHLKRKAAAGWRSIFMMAATAGDMDEAGDDVEGRTTDSEDRFCPLTGFDWTAIEWSMPKSLRAAEAEYAALAAKAAARSSGGDGHHAEAGSRDLSSDDSHFHTPLPALRIWTTILSVTALRRMDESFLLKSSDDDGFEETIVDRGMSYLKHVVRRPAGESSHRHHCWFLLPVS